jgi:hypothetical protein
VHNILHQVCPGTGGNNCLSEPQSCIISKKKSIKTLRGEESLFIQGVHFILTHWDILVSPYYHRHRKLRFCSSSSCHAGLLVISLRRTNVIVRCVSNSKINSCAMSLSLHLLFEAILISNTQKENNNLSLRLWHLELIQLCSSWSHELPDLCT